MKRNATMLLVGLFALLTIALIGCSGFPTVQSVPVPKLEIDPESAIIILNRPSAILAAWNNPSVYDDGNLIGEISNGGTLKWSRKAGTVKLDVFHEQNGKHTFPASEVQTIFEVKNNTVSTLNYAFGGLLAPSSMFLKGDESSKIIFTSYPPGALVYAGTNPNDLKPTGILTPHTMSRPTGSTHWAAEYYKITLDGYKDSPVVFKNNSYGDRIVHYDFINPSNPEPPKAELPVRKESTPQTLIAPAIPQ